MLQDLLRARAMRIASLAVLLVACDYVVSGGQIMSRGYDLTVGYGEGQVEIADLKLPAYGAVKVRLLGIKDVDKKGD